MSLDADRVRKYKKEKSLQINGINYGRVIASRAYEVNLKMTAREFLRMLTYQYKFKLIHKNQSQMLFAYSYRGKERPDYDNIIDSAYKYARKGKIQSDFLDCVYSFSLLNFVNIFKMVYYWVKFGLAKVKKPLFVAILTAQFTSIRKKIETIISKNNYKACITFCDAHGVENLITQIANAHQIKTGTLQHGQYRILEYDVENADVEGYENFISNYLFSWGKVTQNEFSSIGINNDRVLLAGAIKSFSQNHIAERHEPLGVFGVVLCGNVYNESNLGLIKIANKIAKKYNLKYILRMHPKNEENYYLKECDSQYLVKGIKSIENYEYAKMIDFSILHMTGVFVELLSINSPMFIFKDKYMVSLFELDGATFSDLVEFDSCYEKFCKHDKEFLKKQYNLYRNYNCTSDLECSYLKLYKEKLLK